MITIARRRPTLDRRDAADPRGMRPRDESGACVVVQEMRGRCFQTVLDGRFEARR